MNNYRSIAALLCAGVLASCDAFEKTAVQQIGEPVPAGAQIKFFHFGVNAPGVNFYANTVKMTAISSATGIESTTGVVYGGVGSGGFYTGIAPGTITLAGKIAATIDKDLAISNVSQAVATGKYYSYYLSGIYNTTAKTVEAFVVEDAFGAAIDYTQAYVRFVHAISNAAPMTLYAKNTTTLVEMAVGAEISYKGAGAFTAVPAGVYDLGTRFAGVSTNAISRTAVSFSAGRVYTIGSRGDITVVSTTLANRPILDNTANR
jgi:hypothetical protein